MPAVRTPEASRPTRRIAVPRCSLPRRGIGSATSITFDFAALPCGSGLTIRSLAFRPATFLSTLRSGCYQTPRKTRYTAAWLRLCRGRHFRRLNSTRLQGATPSEPYVPVAVHTAQASAAVLAARKIRSWICCAATSVTARSMSDPFIGSRPLVCSACAV